MTDGSVTRIAGNLIAHLEWKIPQYFRQTFKSYLMSPSIPFSGAEWHIRINQMPEWISLELLKGLSQDLNVSVTLGIKQSNNLAFRCFQADHLFTEGVGSWQSPLISRNDLTNFWNLIAPDGVLVIFLTACLKASSSSDTLDTSCQTLSDEVQCNFTTCCGLAQTLDISGFETLSKDYKELFLSESDGDVTFNVKDKKFSAHKLVLTTRSSVFRAMFQAHMKEQNNGSVDISDSDPADFEKFLLYMYSGDLGVVSPSNAYGLYYLADKYNLKELKKSCCVCLSQDISVDSFCDVALLAYLHGETKLLEVATDFFFKHANEIVPTPKWTSLMVKHSTLASELLVKMTNKFFQ